MESSKLYEFLKDKNITESSLKLYLNNLRRLNGGVFPKSFSFLKNVDKILEDLEKYKPNTRRSYLISIITTLKHDPKQKKLYNKYYEHLEKYNKQSSSNNEKSDTQKKNWIEQSEVKEIYDNLTEEIQPLLEKKKLQPSEYEKMLRWVVLSLYTLQKPRRNADYQKCLVVKKLPVKMNLDYNYLDLDTKKWYFNNYKTKGTYKTQEMPINEEVMKMINSYLNFHPMKKQFKNKNAVIPLLVDYQGEPFTVNNAITRILNKIFGKKIGVSMLRNIFLTDKFGDEMKELKEDSVAMGTSSSTIQNQYVKLDSNN
jgi:integrase